MRDNGVRFFVTEEEEEELGILVVGFRAAQLAALSRDPADS